jgi:hypothetical protein
MLSILSERFEIYQFLYDEALKEKDPQIQAALMHRFDEFRKFIRRADQRQYVLAQREKEALAFAAEIMEIAKEETGLQVA